MKQLSSEVLHRIYFTPNSVQWAQIQYLHRCYTFFAYSRGRFGALSVPMAHIKAAPQIDPPPPILGLHNLHLQEIPSTLHALRSNNEVILRDFIFTALDETVA